MSEWKVETATGGAELAHRDEPGRAIGSERADIQAAERAANSAGRTLVFVRLFTDTGMSYFYPLQFLGRLSGLQWHAVGSGHGLAMWTDPAYRQKQTRLPNDAAVDHSDGTAPLPHGVGKFITSRGFPLPPTPQEMEARAWFNLWQNRQWPYREVKEGDTLYWFGTAERAVMWESRIGRLLTFSYQTPDDARQRLRAFFGQPALTDPYLDAAAGRGHGMAYTVERVRRVSVPAPDDFRLPQLGWLRCDGQAGDWLAPLLGGSDGPAAPDLTRVAAAAVAAGQFAAAAGSAERERVLRSVVDRRGQPAFRARLIDAYGGRCAVTGCDAVAALEAAHIVPCGERGTDDVTNGLLLRADIHTLFDLDLIGIDPETLKVRLGPALRDTAYRDLEDRLLTLPVIPTDRPDRAALAARWLCFV